MSDPDIRYIIGEPINDGPLFTTCPFHDDTKPSMAVYADGTWCFVCAQGERPQEFASRMGIDDLSKIPTIRNTTHQTVSSSIDPKRLGVQAHVFNQTLFHGRRRTRIPWLIGRGIHIQTMQEHILGHNGFAFSIPLIVENEIVGIKYRIDPTYAEEESGLPKYWNTKGTKSVPFLSGTGKVLWLVEGEFDAMLLGQYGVTALTSSGGAGALHQDHILDIVKEHRWCYIATDNDEAGNQAFSRICKRLRNEPTKLYRVMQKGKDITDDLLTYDTYQRLGRVDQLIREALFV